MENKIIEKHRYYLKNKNNPTQVFLGFTEEEMIKNLKKRLEDSNYPFSDQYACVEAENPNGILYYRVDNPNFVYTIAESLHDDYFIVLKIEISNQ
jgi:hypothetical protein